MPLPICYLNGQFLPIVSARVSPLDRAFLFGDAVYEVVPVYAGRPFRFREHFDRLGRSLAAIRMTAPLSHQEWADVCHELIARNDGAERDLYLYVQVSRGAEFGRNHVWSDGLVPTLFAYVTPLEPLAAEVVASGVAAVTAQDIRWARRDIKATALLANLLLKKLSADKGAYETILLEGQLREPVVATVKRAEVGAHADRIKTRNLADVGVQGDRLEVARCKAATPAKQSRECRIETGPKTRGDA